MCSKPPACILFKSHSSPLKKYGSPNLRLSPVFQLRSTVKIGNYSVHRTQVPLTPAFAVTDYKVQGRTFTTAILDLKEPSQASVLDIKDFVPCMSNYHGFAPSVDSISWSTSKHRTCASNQTDNDADVALVVE